MRRPPDDSWLWARTNEDAKLILASGRVEEVSLDRDLGLHDVDPDTPGATTMIGHGEETGEDLVKWMCEHRIFPAKITIHSMNVIRSKEMKLLFRDAGCDHAVLVRFQPKGTR